jgi:glycosyltransferase involved in cell wall biosynthesis
MVVMGNHIIPPIAARSKNSVFVCQFPLLPLAGPVQNAKTFTAKYRAVIAFSEYARTHILARLNAYQLPTWPVEVVYPPILQVAGTTNRKENMILSVGRFFAGGPNKRHDLMISAFRILRERFGADIELHLAGSSTPGPEHIDYLDSLRQMARGFPIIFHVNATPTTLCDLYRDAAVYWHTTGLEADLVQNPELAEYFGVAILEAMSAQCVAMAFNAGGPREIITHGVDGFLYESLEELVDTTASILNDRAERREAIGRAAGKRAAALSSPEEFARKLHQIIEQPDIEPVPE